MSETFMQGLILSAIGMGMVFAALAGLWALIALLGRLQMPARRRGAKEDPQVLAELEISEPPLPLPSADEMAAIAVALAVLRAEHDADEGLRRRQPPVLTRWVAVGYGRQLAPWQPPRGRRGQD
ncbi:MAG TPA: OadG family protein [Anaerolineae bacterium]|nr:OadG family protein [Anaerolineae bacterium]HNU03125.1 OadG family protein [Anaerolineae bacterium]